MRSHIFARTFSRCNDEFHNGLRGVQLTVLVVLIILQSVFSPIVSAAELFKCQSRSGQTIYSDIPCDKQGATLRGILDAPPNEVGGGRPSSNEAIRETARGSPQALSTLVNGVPYVNGYIGNIPVRFMVDTGASEVSIPHKRAIELGIPVFAGRRAESLTASGRVGIYKIRLESVTVGNVTVRNVAAHVSLNESGSQDLLLGMSFLQHVTLTVRHGTVSIGP